MTLNIFQQFIDIVPYNFNKELGIFTHPVFRDTFDKGT